MRLPYKKLFNNKGQTLVEITLAMGISVIVIVGLSILATNALKSAQDSVRRSESQKFANAGVEAALFHKNFEGFSGGIFTGMNSNIGTHYCFVLSPAGSVGGSTILVRLLPDGTCGSDDGSHTGSLLSTYGSGYVQVISPTTGLVYGRKIQATKTSENEMNVVSTITWLDTQGTRNVVVSRKLTNWKTN